MKARDDKKYTQRTVGDYHTIDFRTDCKGYANKCCGCTLMTKLQPKTLLKVFAPDADIVGRVGAARYKCNSYDLCPMVPYYPPEDGKQFTKAIIEKMNEYALQVLNSLPARCTPLLMMDVNGKLGRTDINSPPE